MPLRVGGLGSGDSPLVSGSPCLRFGRNSHALGVIRSVTTEKHRDGTRICSVRRSHIPHTHRLRLFVIRWQFTHFRRDQGGYD